MFDRTELLARMAATLAGSGQSTIMSIKNEAGAYAQAAIAILAAVEGLEKERLDASTVR